MLALPILLKSSASSVERISEKGSRSLRDFSLVCQQATGWTPARQSRSHHGIRKKAAGGFRTQFEPGHATVRFGDEERMRVTFQRDLGVSAQRLSEAVFAITVCR